MTFGGRSTGINWRWGARRLFVAAVLMTSPTFGALLTPGNIIAADRQAIREYTPSGALVQTIAVPAGGGDGNGLHDLAVDDLGNVNIYNGLFSPVLTQFNPATSTFTHQTGDFSTANVLNYGGLAVAGSFVYVVDWNTSGSPNTGLLRFNIAGGPTQRFASGNQYSDVTLGRDGLLYALAGSTRTSVHVYNPFTAAFIRPITLSAEVTSIAVAADGSIFGTSLQGSDGFKKFNSSGTQIGNLTDTVGGLVDIDIDASGNILIASHGGGIVQTTTALTPMTSFNYRHSTGFNFAAWVQPPPTPTPEPGTAIVTLAVGGLLLMRPRRRAAPLGWK